jgi:hypothetical protein
MAMSWGLTLDDDSDPVRRGTPFAYLAEVATDVAIRRTRD